MTIQHNVLTDPELHEPKGVSTATSGQVYIANGSGSGSWGKIEAEKRVVVNSESDFPSPSGGVITLAANTEYRIGNDITTANRFVMADNSCITSSNFFSPTLTYTGSGTMFTGSDTNVCFDHVRLDCPTAKVFDFVDTAGGVKIFLMETVQIDSCAKFGTFDDLISLVISNSNSPAANDGIELLGSNWLIFSLSKFALISTSAAFTGIDFGSSVHSTIEVTDVLFSAPSGATGISGLANNGNISANKIASVFNSEFSGGMTPLSGITEDDFRWRFLFNQGTRDTKADAMVSLTNNSTATVISATSTPVKVAGTFVVERESHFTADTTGKVTYDGETDIVVPVDISITLDPAAGTNQDLRTYLALNGSVITNSGKTIRVDSGSPEGVSIIWQLTLTTGDFLEVFVENVTSTNNVIAKDAVMRVR